VGAVEGLEGVRHPTMKRGAGTTLGSDPGVTRGWQQQQHGRDTRAAHGRERERLTSGPARFK
jgi:hypothetical protein